MIRRYVIIRFIRIWIVLIRLLCNSHVTFAKKAKGVNTNVSNVFAFLLPMTAQYEMLYSKLTHARGLKVYANAKFVTLSNFMSRNNNWI